MDPDLLPGSGPRLCIGPEYNETDNRTWEALQEPENRTWGLLKGALRKPKLVRGRSSRGGKIVPGASSGLLEPPGASWGFPGTIGWGEEAYLGESGGVRGLENRTWEFVWGPGGGKSYLGGWKIVPRRTSGGRKIVPGAVWGRLGPSGAVWGCLGVSCASAKTAAE